MVWVVFEVFSELFIIYSRVGKKLIVNIIGVK